MIHTRKSSLLRLLQEGKDLFERGLKVPCNNNIETLPEVDFYKQERAAYNTE